jgi:predicted metalloenzyme YecM
MVRERRRGHAERCTRGGHRSERPAAHRYAAGVGDWGVHPPPLLPTALQAGNEPPPTGPPAPLVERLFNTLDPVLQAEGRKREEGWESSLQEAGLADLTVDASAKDDDGPPTWEMFCAAAAAVPIGQNAYGREVMLTAQVGAFDLQGRVDFVVLLWRDGRAVLRLVECKASRRDRTYQRLQVCMYLMMVARLLETEPLVVGGRRLGRDDLEAVVARIDEATNESQEILRLEPLDLSMEEADLTRLLAADGQLAAIAHTDLDQLGYQLDQKCDGCVFNVDCLPETGRMRRHELLGVSAATATALRAAGLATLDDLAEVDLAGEAARAVRADPGFTESLEQLKVLAAVRRTTLPGGGVDPDAYPVQSLPNAPASQLPEHEIGGERLLRVYLCVDYDYTENRLGALAAHITRSDWQVHTDFVPEDPAQPDGRRVPEPAVKERRQDGVDEQGRKRWVTRQLQGREVVVSKGSEWSGRYEEDTGAERELIQNFIRQLVDAISDVAGTELARVHFYVWSRSEMARLVEACSRASSRLLGALRELLGCRESLEQLIYSCLQDEVDRRFALGWTGRGLAVVASLPWFGRRYHWRRMVSGRPVDLDRVFTQDIFDFKTTLGLTADGAWARSERDTATSHRFEIRSRFHDSLTAPYWRAVWGTLPDPDDPRLPRDVANAIRRYNEAQRPNRLTEYLKARTHALRWVEEGVRFKNPEIDKPQLNVEELHRFTLGVANAAQAGVDFLRLDHFVHGTDWVAWHLLSTATRVPTGRTLPISEVVAHDGGRLTAVIDLTGHDLDYAALEARCPFGPGSMVRLSPHSGDPAQGQTVRQLLRGGKTCVITSIDWRTGQVALEGMFTNATRYILLSVTSDPGPVFEHATIDESPSDFVAGRVESRLTAGLGTHVFDWFDPERPQIPPRVPLPRVDRDRWQAVLSEVTPGEGEDRLAVDQQSAVLDGLDSRVQLLQGPPGTGKTMTSAVSVVLRAAHRLQTGDVLLVAANTHTAVNNLLNRVQAVAPAVQEAAAQAGVRMPRLTVAKVHSSPPFSDPLGPPGLDFFSRPSVRIVNRERAGAVLVVGGTTSAVLKLAAELDQRQPWGRSPNGFQTRLLVVDEASMMVFPHFLALASLVGPDGDIMLAGDHRQLAPILAHDWEHEDRPPAVLYQPYASAYNAVRDIARKPDVLQSQVQQSALRYTFRLPPLIVELIARLYRLDEIELEGIARAEPRLEFAVESTRSPWQAVWDSPVGLYLVLHSEQVSRQSNEFEAELVRRLLGNAPLLPDGSVAVITPHRAQRSLLATRLADLDSVDLVDTVERLQGGERPTVIVSGTASDPNAISANAEFLLDLNRSNVAFSRARDRLVVVCAQTLLDHIPADLEDYQSAMLWKALRALCTRLIAMEEIAGHRVQVLTVPAALTEAHPPTSAELATSLTSADEP